jgi:hypothetical protein
MAWFSARRLMDGLPDDPRAAKRAGMGGAAGDAPATPRRGRRGGALDYDGVDPWAPEGGDAPETTDPGHDARRRAEAAAAAADAAAAEAAAARKRVSRLTARGLSALRSALPSPAKLKGARLAEELGLQAAADGRSLHIAGVTLLARDGSAAWRGAWRRRRAVRGLPAQRLDFARWFAT